MIKIKLGPKRLGRNGIGGETTRVENRGYTTRGERIGGKRLGGETSCNPDHDQNSSEVSKESV